MNSGNWWSGMERLEERRLLAGNVTAEVIRGTLWIRGDGAANDLRVGYLQSPPLQVEGINTTINGKSDPFVPDGFSAIRIVLGDGDDRLEMNFIEVLGDVLVRAGKGDDTIFATTVNARQFILDTREGRDSVIVKATGSSQGGGTLSVNTGSSDDFVFLEELYQKKVIVDTEQGNNKVLVRDVRNARPVLKSTGGDQISSQDFVRDYDFNKGTQGWRAGFADYFAGRESEHQLTSGWVQDPYQGVGKRFLLKGKNITDDLFMFLTRKVGGLKPNTDYLAMFDIVFDSNAEHDCAGIGGAPGESVYLKAGATKTTPRVRTDEEGVQRLNVDHGQQGTGGSAATVLGNISNGLECGTNLPPNGYYRTERTGMHRTLVRTDGKGRLHVIVGTDSGYEGTTALYYEKIKVELVEALGKARGFEERYVPVI